MRDIKNLPDFGHEGLNVFAEHLDAQSKEAPGGDDVIAAICLGGLIVLKENGAFTHDMGTFVERLNVTHASGGSSGSEAAGIFRTDFVADVLAQNDDQLPEGLEDPNKVAHIIRQIYHDDFRAGMFLQRALHRRVQTAVREREAPYEIVLQALYGNGIIERGLVGLDVGCGGMQGPLGLMVKDRLPFGPVTVTDPTKLIDVEKSIYAEDEDQSAKTTTLLNRPKIVDELDAVDIMNAFDPETRRWGRASLRLRAELLNPDYMKVYDDLAAIKPEDVGVNFFRVDFSDPHDVQRFFEHIKGKKYDFVRYNTVLHQGSRRTYHYMRSHGDQVLKPAPTALSSEQDFGQINPQDPYWQEFIDDWHVPYSYRTFARTRQETSHPLGALQELVRSRNSRCKELQFLGRLIMAGEVFSVDDLVRTA